MVVIQFTCKFWVFLAKKRYFLNCSILSEQLNFLLLLNDIVWPWLISVNINYFSNPTHLFKNIIFVRSNILSDQSCLTFFLLKTLLQSRRLAFFTNFYLKSVGKSTEFSKPKIDPNSKTFHGPEKMKNKAYQYLIKEMC